VILNANEHQIAAAPNGRRRLQIRPCLLLRGWDGQPRARIEKACESVAEVAERNLRA
jgi:hypothetical protein